MQNLQNQLVNLKYARSSIWKENRQLTAFFQQNTSCLQKVEWRILEQVSIFDGIQIKMPDKQMENFC